MSCETVNINGMEYVKKDSVPLPSGKIRIVVLQRGWVAVGYLSQKDSICRLERASIIRTWGTTKGLGEIAYNGPTDKTILDKCPPIEYHELTAIMTISCVEEKWITKLS